MFIISGGLAVDTDGLTEADVKHFAGRHSMDRADIITIIKQSFEGLIKSGLIPEADRIALHDNTVIFGATSPLDSISFVTLVSDVEDRMNMHSTNDLAIDLTEIDNFSVEEPNLTVAKLADFLVELRRRAQ